MNTNFAKFNFYPPHKDKKIYKQQCSRLVGNAYFKLFKFERDTQYRFNLREYYMVWIISSLIKTAIIFILTFLLFREAHIEIGNDFLWISIILAFVTTFIYQKIFKYIMPNRYIKYELWKEKHYKFITITLLPLFGYMIFFYSFMSYINQRNIVSPIETINRTITKKRVTQSRSSNSYYTDIYISPSMTLSISGSLYYLVNINDKVAIKIQKGMLGHYFALELTILKSNYKLKL